MTNSIRSEVDVIINAAEINDRQGVGILLRRIFKDRSRIFSIRSRNLYGGNCTFGEYNYLLGGAGLSRIQIFSRIEKSLRQHTVKRVLCVPYHAEEIFAALAVQELFGAKICTYLMDDQNILTTSIPDQLMAELLTKSNLRLAISPEMRDVYIAKYQMPIYFVPPVIPIALIKNCNIEFCLDTEQKSMGVIFGNIWSPRWLDLLRVMIGETGHKIDWYGNTGTDWYFKNRSKLSDDGIVERGFLSTEAEVVDVLRNYSYVVVPSGTLDKRDDNLATSWLSLPSRIPFILATTNIPIIVLGNSNTAAARFVTRVGIGTVADYTSASFQAAVSHVTKKSVQDSMRANAARIAHRFVNEHMDEWIWQSLMLGKPIDDRFEVLLANPLEYTTAFTTCLDIIRQQQTEINQLKFRFKLFSSPIEYIRELSHKWLWVRRIWLRLKGQL
jgi:hypothetical protein